MINLERKDYYKNLFLVGAIFALAVGIIFFILFLFYNPGLTPVGQVYNLFFRAFTILNGIGYYIVSRDITKNHGYVFVAIIGKVMVFVFFLIAFILSIFSIIEVIFGIIDLIFAILYAEFLINFDKI